METVWEVSGISPECQLLRPFISVSPVHSGDKHRAGSQGTSLLTNPSDDWSHMSPCNLKCAFVFFIWQGTKDMRPGSHPWPGCWNSIHALTTLDVEGMMFVQVPSSQLGSIDFIALQHSCSFFPEDQIWAGFILIAHRNCRKQKVQNAQVSKASALALICMQGSGLSFVGKEKGSYFSVGTRCMCSTNTEMPSLNILFSKSNCALLGKVKGNPLTTLKRTQVNWFPGHDPLVWKIL